MSRKFIFDQMGFYVWALKQKWPSNPDGYDMRMFAPDYNDYPQADLATIQSELENELMLNADHQRLAWLEIDGAIEAVAMLESDGLINTEKPELNKSWYAETRKGRKNSVYTTRVRPNVERVKNHYRNIPAMWSALSEDPEATTEAIEGFNAYNRHIASENNWFDNRDSVLNEGIAFGSGAVNVLHDANLQMPDDTWFEERALQGQPLEYDEFRRFHKTVRSHVIEYVPTFELVRHRTAYGEGARQLSGERHPLISRVRQRRIADVVAEYPSLSGKLSADIHSVFKKINPYSLTLHDQHDTVTEIRHQIRMPLRYTLPVTVHIGNGIFETIKKDRRRVAIVEVVEIMGQGIVDMYVDRYHHNHFTYEQWMPQVSSKHACGIGLCKYGRDMERTFNILLNGSLRYFRRMSKGGGFYITGVMDENELERRTEEHAWIGIDSSKLPPDLRKRPISDLIQDNRPPNLPAVYDQIMIRAEDSVNRAMMVPDAARGIRQGESGRHELALKEQADQAMGPGAARWVAFHKPIGIRIHSNVVQFDGDQEIDLHITDPFTGERQHIVLNKPEGMVEQYDPIQDDYFIFPQAVKNRLMGLRFTTQISTNSLIPANPSQRLFFYQDLAQRLFPYIQMGPTGYAFLEWLDQYAYGGVPGIKKLIQKLQGINEAMMERDSEAALAQAAMEAEQADRNHQIEAGKLAQNAKRLDDHKLIKLMDIKAKAEDKAEAF